MGSNGRRNTGMVQTKTPWFKSAFIAVMMISVAPSIWMSTSMGSCSTPNRSLMDAPNHGAQQAQDSDPSPQEELAQQNQRVKELEAQLSTMAEAKHAKKNENSDSKLHEELARQKKRAQELEGQLSTSTVAQKSNADKTQNSESGLQEEVARQNKRIQELEAQLSTVAHPYKDETMRPYDPSRYTAKRLAIDNEDELDRCRRYGFKYNPRVRDKKNPRRVFFGALIADDPMDLLEAQATENYGIFHSVVFIESNLTLTRVPRETKYHPGSPRLATLQNGFFGPATKVHVHQFMDDIETESIEGMSREWLQREPILDIWIKNGMRPDDIGISGDADEMFSRDFLRALQICDVPVLRPGQDCEHPKVLGSGLIFEGSPECITQRKHLWKPDLILGECLEGIGDPTGRPIAKRLLPRNRGPRERDWRQSLPKDQKLFPLWTSCEVRTLKGGMQPFMDGEYGRYHGIPAKRTHRATAYHMHNFFPNVATLRHKYGTYGHANQHSNTLNLADLGNDMTAFFKCVKGIEPTPEDKYKSTPGGFKVYADKGPMPLYFDEEYVKWKHTRMQQIVEEDEKLLKTGR